MYKTFNLKRCYPFILSLQLIRQEHSKGITSYYSQLIYYIKNYTNLSDTVVVHVLNNTTDCVSTL